MAPWHDAVADLRVAGFADVAEQMRGQRLGRDTAASALPRTTTSGSSKSSRRAVTAATCASDASSTTTIGR